MPNFRKLGYVVPEKNATEMFCDTDDRQRIVIPICHHCMNAGDTLMAASRHMQIFLALCIFYMQNKISTITTGNDASDQISERSYIYIHVQKWKNHGSISFPTDVQREKLNTPLAYRKQPTGAKIFATKIVDGRTNNRHHDQYIHCTTLKKRGGNKHQRL